MIRLVATQAKLSVCLSPSSVSASATTHVPCRQLQFFFVSRVRCLTCPSSCRSYCSKTRSKLDTRALCSFRLNLTSTVVLDLTFSNVCLRSTIVVLFSVTCWVPIELDRRHRVTSTFETQGPMESRVYYSTLNVSSIWDRTLHILSSHGGFFGMCVDGCKR